MSKLILNTECKLYAHDGKAYCNSRQVAEEFGKRHADILRSIEGITDPSSGASAEFTERNFALSSYKDASGRKNPEYLMTKDGFSILTMGFTGKKAMRFKESYIQRFNQMEDFIRSLQTAKLEYPAFTQAILEAHEEPKHYHFSNEADMVNRIVLGMSAKQFREANGIAKGESIRPYLNAGQIKAIEELQRADVGLLLAMPDDFEGRKEALTRYRDRLGRKLIA